MSPWLRLTLGGQRWRVFVVSPRSKYLVDTDGTVHVGRCVYERCGIYLSRDLQDGALEDALLHELLHALLYVTGAEEAYGKSHKAEERLVSALTPALHRLLRDLGLRFPTRAS